MIKDIDANYSLSELQSMVDALNQKIQNMKEEQSEFITNGGALFFSNTTLKKVNPYSVVRVDKAGREIIVTGKYRDTHKRVPMTYNPRKPKKKKSVA